MMKRFLAFLAVLGFASAAWSLTPSQQLVLFNTQFQGPSFVPAAFQSANMYANTSLANSDGSYGQVYERIPNVTKRLQDVFSTASTSAGRTALDASGNVVDFTNHFNAIRNSTMQGAVIGTPGSFPTYWANFIPPGVTANIVNVGVQNGINFIDINYSGTPTGTNYNGTPDNGTTIAAAQGQTWNASYYLALISGSLPTGYSQNVFISENQNSTYLTGGSVISVTGLTSTLQRFSGSRTLANASTNNVGTFLNTNFTAGIPWNFTLRVGAPQLQPGSVATAYVPTYGTAAGELRATSAGLTTEGSRTNLFLNSGSPATQTITVANASTYTISLKGSGSIIVTGACTGTATQASPLTCTTSTTALVATVSGTITYPQVELGAFKTSPIITFASAVPRTADNIYATDVSWLTQGQGAIQTNVTFEGINSTVSNTMLSVDDNTFNDVFGLYVSTISVEAVNTRSAGANQWGPTFSTITGGTHKAVLSYSFGVASATYDAATVQSSSISTVPTFSGFHIGVAGDLSRPMSGVVNAASFFPTSLTNAQLQAVTQ